MHECHSVLCSVLEHPYHTNPTSAMTVVSHLLYVAAILQKPGGELFVYMTEFVTPNLVSVA
jgi:hypothetical protein